MVALLRVESFFNADFMEAVFKIDSWIIGLKINERYRIRKRPLKFFLRSGNVHARAQKSRDRRGFQLSMHVYSVS